MKIKIKGLMKETPIDWLHFLWDSEQSSLVIESLDRYASGECEHHSGLNK
jgi:hypothetical protein